MPSAKTRLMLDVERCLGRPLEDALPALYREKGLMRTAKELGVCPTTLYNWLLRLGYTTSRVLQRIHEG
jgi:hypothetical protein